jgi:hypothetical protein
MALEMHCDGCMALCYAFENNFYDMLYILRLFGYNFFALASFFLESPGSPFYSFLEAEVWLANINGSSSSIKNGG